MAGLGDELFNSLGDEESVDLPDIESHPEAFAEPEPEVILEGSRSLGIIKGTLATAMAPKISLPKKKSLVDELDDAVGRSEKGYSPSKPTVIHDPKEAMSVAKAPKGLGDLLDEELNSRKSFTNSEDPGFLSQAWDSTWSVIKKPAKMALTALSIDEHLMVKGLSKWMGDPDKEDISDYTWNSFLLHRGAPDNSVTTGMGIAMSIFLSPTTYLSFGTTGAVKLGGKAGTTLTRGGEKLVNGIVKDRAEMAIAEKVSKIGRELTEAESNSVRRKMAEEVHQEVIEKFSSIQSKSKNGLFSKEVSDLPKSAFDLGGINIQVPFGRKKYNVISGERIAAIVNETALPKIAEVGATVGQYMDAAGQAAQVVPGIKAISAAGRAAKDEFVDPMVSGINGIRKTIGKMVIPGYGKPADLLDLIEEATVSSEKAKLHAIKQSEEFFSGLDKDQLKDFAQSAYKADFDNPAEKVIVQSISNDSKVQDKLDQWFSQGKYAGKQSEPERIKNLLGKHAELIDGIERPNWFPGIIKGINVDDIKLNQSLKNREFLKARVGDPDAYTTNPIQAVSVRLTQISMANIMDEMFENAVKKGMGEIKTADAIKKLKPEERAGYVIFRSPVRKYLVGDSPIENRFKEPGLYVKKEFAEAFDEALTKQDNYIPFVSQYTNVFKSGVTMAFPTFYARNIRSNIVFNSYSIGLQALNPKRFHLASLMASGKKLDKEISTEIGEKLTLREIVEEAKSHGLIGHQDPFFDLAGEGLKGEAKSVYHSFLQSINPLNQNNIVLQAGSKINQQIENQARLLNYMNWRIRGADPRMAAMEAKEALLDYSKITPFERKWANQVIPFYSFQKKNLEKHIKLTAQRPMFTASYLKVMRDLGPTDEEWAGFPEQYKRRALVRWQGMMVGGWGLPIEDVLEKVNLEEEPEGFGAMLTPLIRFPAERMFNRDTYSGRDLHTVNSANEFKFFIETLEDNNSPEWEKGVARRAVHLFGLKRDPSKRDKVIGDPYRLHFLRAMPTSRWQSTIGMAQREDMDWIKFGYNFLLGFTAMTPDESLQASIERQKGNKRISRFAVQSGFAFPLEFAIGKDENTKDYLSDIFGDRKDTRSKRRLQDIEKRAMDRLERMRERSLPE